MRNILEIPSDVEVTDPEFARILNERLRQISEGLGGAAGGTSTTIRTGGGDFGAGGSPAAPVAPGNVTDITATFVYTYLRGGTPLLNLSVNSYTPAADPFAGVNVGYELPDASADTPVTAGESVSAGATIGASGTWPLIQGPRVKYVAGKPFLVPLPDAPLITVPTDVRLYLASFSSQIDNPFVRATDASPTPSVVITVQPPPLIGPKGSEYCDQVIDFSVAVTEILVGAVKRARLVCNFTKPGVRQPTGLYIYIKNDLQTNTADTAHLQCFNIGAVTDSGQAVEMDLPKQIVSTVIYATGFIDPNGSPTPDDDAVNTIVDGITAKYTTTFGSFTGTVDLGEGMVSSVNPALTVVNKILGVAQQGITNDLIALFAVATAQLADAAVATGKIQDLSVIIGKIGPAAVDATKIANLAVQTAHLENAAVTNAKIGLLAVDTTNIANAAITNAKVGALAVASANIQLAAITTTLIQNAAITTALINNLAVTDAKIGDVAANKIAAGTIIATITIVSPNITGGTIVGSSLTLNLNGITTTIANDSTIFGFAGLKILRNTNSAGAWVTAGQMYLVGATGASQVVILADAAGGYFDMTSSSGVQTIILDASTGSITFTKLRSSNYLSAGSPGSAATHKVPFYDASGTLVNYYYLYP